MMTTTPHIVVLGAGYTGLTAAKLLAKRTGATVTLVNERDRFVERMRNHQLASGQRLRDMPLGDLLEGTGIRPIIDHVTGIDAAQRQVELARGAEPVGYDLLVNALGSRPIWTPSPALPSTPTPSPPPSRPSACATGCAPPERSPWSAPG